ncbi:SH3 domain-binding protein 5-like [Leptonychotes weddellii]|uniref:SH3 domain-binding protein 5 n=1 Tax=Leptonychotes weddellii TaxID=9713 RepID=A0A7F8RP12_LEPWE|nr:SH3 domain-binding protein 5-like [Leptonychotes weddellii]
MADASIQGNHGPPFVSSALTGTSIHQAPELRVSSSSHGLVRLYCLLDGWPATHSSCPWYALWCPLGSLYSITLTVFPCVFHRPYFELKAKYYVQLEQLKKTVDDLQAKLALAKGEYKTALKNLEMISDEIHERRRSSAMGPRGCGVGAEGSGTSVEDLSGSKPEPDAVSVASEAFEDDNCSNFVSEDDSETQSVSSFSSGPTSPSEMPDQFPAAVRPGSLDLPSPVSLSEFGLMFPVLGPRSECSGASSPECEVERGDRAEGAENKTSDKANNNRGLGSGGSKSQSSTAREGQALENRMKQLSLQCSKGRDGVIADIQMVQIG